MTDQYDEPLALGPEPASASEPDPELRSKPAPQMDPPVEESPESDTQPDLPADLSPDLRLRPGSTAPATPATAPPIPMLVGRRQFARTTPIVVDRGRASFGLPSFGDRRQAGQVGLVVLMIAALGAILVARGGAQQTPGANGGSALPHGLLSASPRSTPTGSASPIVGPGPSASSPGATPTSAPRAKPKTYTVRSGDTLSGIAARFHTTAKIIEQLNGIRSPYVIHPGEVLKLP